MSTGEMERSEWVALLLFEFTGVSEGRYREDIVLIQATSEQEAVTIARAHGQAQEGSSLNADGEDSGLAFRAIVDVASCLYDRPAGVVWDLYARHFEDLPAYEKFEKNAVKFVEAYSKAADNPA